MEVAVQFSEPPPVLLIVTTCAAGLDPPWVPVKVNDDGAKLIVGAAAVIVRVTGTVWGVLVAPVAEMVMVAL